MLHLVRANSPYTVLILAILTLVLKLQALGHHVLPVADAHHALFGYIVWLLKHVLGNSRTAFSMLAILITFGQAIYLMSIASRHRLFSKHTYVPAFAYIVLSSLHPAMGQFSAPLLLNWLLLGALDTVLHFNRREGAQRLIFNAGFLLGCAALIHFPAVIYGMLLVLALLWLRAFRLGEWVVGLLGYLTPYYFAACLLYLFNRWDVVKAWPHWGLGLPQKGALNPYLVGLIIGCAILLVGGIFILTKIFYRMPVAARRGWGAIGTALAVSIAVCSISPKAETAAWMNVLPSLSLLIIPPMLGEKRSRFATFTFYFLLTLVFYCQIMLSR